MPRTYRKEFYGKIVSAYNDSNFEWVVIVEGSTLTQRFEKRKWTMKDAMEFAARVYTGIDL